MATHEIQNDNWQEFCQRFTRLHRGTQVSIELIHPDGNTEQIAEDLPLDSMKMERTDGCNDLVHFTLGHGTGERAQFTLIDPIHVKVRQHATGPKTLQVDAENGSAMVTFHSGKIRELLQGLQVFEGKHQQSFEYQS